MLLHTVSVKCGRRIQAREIVNGTQYCCGSEIVGDIK